MDTHTHILHHKISSWPDLALDLRTRPPPPPTGRPSRTHGRRTRSRTSPTATRHPTSIRYWPLRNRRTPCRVMSFAHRPRRATRAAARTTSTTPTRERSKVRLVSCYFIRNLLTELRRWTFLLSFSESEATLPGVDGCMACETFSSCCHESRMYSLLLLVFLLYYIGGTSVTTRARPRRACATRDEWTLS